MVNSQVSLLNLILEADIHGDVITYRRKESCVCVSHHDGLFVDMVDDYLDEKIDGGTED